MVISYNFWQAIDLISLLTMIHSSHCMETSQFMQVLSTHSELEGRAGDVSVHVLDTDSVNAKFLGDKVDSE